MFMLLFYYFFSLLRLLSLRSRECQALLLSRPRERIWCDAYFPTQSASLSNFAQLLFSFVLFDFSNHPGSFGTLLRAEWRCDLCALAYLCMCAHALVFIYLSSLSKILLMEWHLKTSEESVMSYLEGSVMGCNWDLHSVRLRRIIILEVLDEGRDGAQYWQYMNCSLWEESLNVSHCFFSSVRCAADAQHWPKHCLPKMQKCILRKE